jgi:uncharacterized protein (UPF0264 family)
MRLLVSVGGAAEASAALAGGADLVDAKNWSAGALGAVSIDVLREIYEAIAGERPVSAALGDAVNEGAIEDAARAFAAIGASFVKIGFAGVVDPRRVSALVAAAVRGASSTKSARACGVVAVAYADCAGAASIAPPALPGIAASAGARGVLVDTADKNAPGLTDLVAPRDLAAWIAEAHRLGLVAAVAGKLAAGDLPFVREAGADIAGVRGAACDGGRAGSVSVLRVRALRARCSAEIGLAANATIDRPR